MSFQVGAQKFGITRPNLWSDPLEDTNPSLADNSFPDCPSVWSPGVSFRQTTALDTSYIQHNYVSGGWMLEGTFNRSFGSGGPPLLETPYPELCHAQDLPTPNQHLDMNSLNNHVPSTTIPDGLHGQSSDDMGTHCNECDAQFDKKSALKIHAKHTKHAPHLCKCGKRFARLDILDRHIHTFQPITTHPCPYCNKFRGSKAFPRRDHLLQHLRQRHNIETISDTDEFPSFHHTGRDLSCHHEDCPYFRTLSHPGRNPFQERGGVFRNQSELRKHLREVHSESPFECTEPYCSRKGSRGFFRKGDLLRHKKEHHSIAFQPSLMA
ncbi:Zinc finger protein [Lachnellula suecica]|uniref:Zinc finger protein n=1 Tax=Lachnellula suecica TaxID=602035 RepID=A0A8T9C0E7_9HELO|nr:Zinc finger protein [Lachnellula suecica]